MNYKVIAFDLGGTLMEFKDMPLSWADYYENGFRNVNRFFNCNISEEDIEKSVAILKSFNPRINYREIEYSAEHIFKQALEHWKYEVDLSKVIDKFFDAFNLEPIVYEDSIDVLKKLKSKGYFIAALTDLPSGMPDRIFKSGVRELLEHIDLYVSSQSSGFRKPNPKGIYIIAENFGVDVSKILFVGDEEKDRQTAVNAGCDFLFIDSKKGG